MNRGITQKQYLGLVPPTEEDARSSQMRILDALKEKGITASFTLPALQKLYPICDEADYNITVSLAWNGSIWQVVDLEAGDTAAEHYGYAADLGSTTVVVRLVNCSDGTVLAEESEYNRQSAYGTDILTRIFACKDKPEVLQDIRACTMETFTLLFEKLRQKTGIAPSDVLSMVVSGNTTMIHFLLGLDPFCVFSSPYAVRADRVGFLPAKEMGFPMKGCSQRNSIKKKRSAFFLISERTASLSSETGNFCSAAQALPVRRSRAAWSKPACELQKALLIR